jgi:hypothetical protein
MQAIINADRELGGTFRSVTCCAAVRKRALQLPLQGCVHWMVRDVLKLDDPPESDGDESDDDASGADLEA